MARIEAKKAENSDIRTVEIKDKPVAAVITYRSLM